MQMQGTLEKYVYSSKALKLKPPAATSYVWLHFKKHIDGAQCCVNVTDGQKESECAAIVLLKESTSSGVSCYLQVSRLFLLTVSFGCADFISLETLAATPSVYMD